MKSKNGEIEVRYSKKYFLFFTMLGISTALIISLKLLSEEESALTLYSIVLVLFGIPIIYCLLKAFDKKPIYTLNNNSIELNRKQKVYNLKDLHYYRYEEIGIKYGTFEYIYFYDAGQNLIFKIGLTGTDCSKNTIETFLQNKVTQLTNE